MDDRLSAAPFPGTERLTHGRPSSPETRPLRIFPARVSRVMAQGIENGVGWTKQGETSGKEYVSLALAAPEFGPSNSTPIWAAQQARTMTASALRSGVRL